MKRSHRSFMMYIFSKDDIRLQVDKVHLQGLSVRGPSPSRKAVFTPSFGPCRRDLARYQETGPEVTELILESKRSWIKENLSFSSIGSRNEIFMWSVCPTLIIYAANHHYDVLSLSSAHGHA